MSEEHYNQGFYDAFYREGYNANTRAYREGWAAGTAAREEEDASSASSACSAYERADFHARVAKAQGHPSFRNYQPS